MPREKKPKPPPDPNRLVRRSAGEYATPDERFVAQGSGSGEWYLSDSERTDDFGLPLLAGPYRTLGEVREAVVAAREGGTTPGAAGVASPEPVSLDAVRAARRERPEVEAGPAPGAEPEPEPEPEPVAGPSAEADPEPEPEPEAEQTWPDRLDGAERRRAQRLIAALEREGIDDAERLARGEIEGSLPLVARTVLLQRVLADVVQPWEEVDRVETLRGRRRPPRRLAPIVGALGRLREVGADDEDLAAFARHVAFVTAGRTLELLTVEGNPDDDLPGWRLDELDERHRPTGRSILASGEDLERADPGPGEIG